MRIAVLHTDKMKVARMKFCGVILEGSFYHACVEVSVLFVQLGTGLRECLLILGSLLFPVSRLKPALSVLKGCFV